MRVERRKFPLFLPDFGAILYFFTDSIVASRVQGGKYRGLPPMRGVVRMLQSPLRGGEGGWEYVKFIVKRPKSVSSDPSFCPWHLTHSHSVGNNITILEGMTHSRDTFNSLENLVPAQVSVQSRAESQKKHSNTTQQNGTELEAN